jgi:conjugal transfer mating pair stabilization protein TraN
MTMRRRLAGGFSALIMLLVNVEVLATNCQLVSTVCADATPTKVISGATINVADVGGCWDYKSTYNCIDPNAVDNCTNLKSSTPQCYSSNAQCTANGFDGSCLSYNMSYQCKNTPLADTTNVTQQPTTYNITSDTTTNGCAQYEAGATAGTCQMQSSICTDGPSTRNINGLDVTRSCWNTTDTYACAGPMTDNCAALRTNTNCRETSSYCMDSTSAGSCNTTEHVYTCGAPSVSNTATNCSTRQFCFGGTCFGAGSTPDRDLNAVIASMETTRQATNYSLFKGEADFCGKPLGGLVNCCKSSPGGGGGSNHAIAQGLMMTGLQVGAEEVWIHGSQYVFEGLMNTGSEMLQEYALSGLSSGVLSTSANFSVYGAQFSMTTSSGIEFIGFNPYSLALAVALHILMSLLSCSQDEQALALKKGQNLCHYVGSFCSNRFLGVCLTSKESYCCFPSVLGRIINEQGRPQIGKGWGAAEGPDCSGFTVDQFSQLDFSNIDLTEFINDIVPVASRDASYATQRATGNMQNQQNLMRSYYGN